MSICLLVAPDEPLDPGGQLPVGSDDPGAMKPPLSVNMPVQHIRPHHVGVVRVRVLPELRLDYSLPVVTEHVFARPDLHGSSIT